MAKKDPEGGRRKGSDKHRDHFAKNGKFTTKHIRIQESLQSKINKNIITNKK